MKRKLAMTWALGAALLLPAAAWAQTAYTNRDVNMRAGPNQEFPLVTRVMGGAPVYVNGCVDGYTWCDVTAGQDRGWIAGDYMSYPYQNQPVTIVSGGALLGLPLITFAVAPYWDNYYRGRTWYGNRSNYYNRPANWWYRAPPQRYYQPVIRPYPQHYNSNQYSVNRPQYNNQNPYYYNNNHNNNSNNNSNQNHGNRPAPHSSNGNRPPQQQQARPPTERSPELRQSSPSQRSYSQQ